MSGSRSGPSAGCTLLIALAAWLGMTAFFFGVYGAILSDESGWLGQHGGWIIWSTLGLVLLVGVVVAIRNRRLGVALLLAGVAGYLSASAVIVYFFVRSGAGE